MSNFEIYLGKDFNVKADATAGNAVLLAADADVNVEYFITNIILSAEGVCAVTIDDGTTDYLSVVHMVDNQVEIFAFELPLHTAPNKQIRLVSVGAGKVNAQVIGYKNP